MVSSETFPQLNKIFRKKEISTIPEIIKIPSNKVEIIRNINLNPDNIDKDEKGNFLITDNNDKLNTMGSHFDTYTKQRYGIGKPEQKN